jgi:galactoside O-acetyltransferase
MAAMKNILKTLGSEWLIWSRALLNSIPGRIGNKIRYCLYRPFFAACGTHVVIVQGCDFCDFRNIAVGHNVSFGPQTRLYAQGHQGESITIGNHVSFNTNVMINANCGGKVSIGNNVLVGPNVVMRASGHHFDRRDIPIREQGHTSGSIQIEDDVWIGANVVILPDTVIRRGAVIAAGAVVTKGIESYTIAGGIPAKPIRMRGNA